MIYVFFSLEPYPLPIAKHLIDEGHKVVVGVVKSVTELGIPDSKDDETPQFKKQRLSCYDGLLKKQPFGQVLSMLAKVPKNKQDEYFVFFDHSNLFNIAETVSKMGFKRGLFPTKWDWRMEKERELAKDFVKKNYPDVRVADSFNFKTVKEGIAHIEKSDSIYVLKSNGNAGKAIVPRTSEVEVGKRIVTSALLKDRANYETGGFLLEEKIANCLEVTPVMVFYNGEYVYSLVEMECKSLGAGDIGVQKGGAIGLNVRTEQHCRMNEIAFPKVIYDLAKKKPGIAIYDAGLLYNGEDFYFTEFCSARFGWDGMFSEMVMRDEGEPFVAKFFEDICNGVNPLKNKYGAAVRLFNLEGNGEETASSKDDIPVEWEEDVADNTFFYLIKKAPPGEGVEEGDVVSVGGYDLLGVATGASDSLDTAVGRAYYAAERVIFEKIYYRPMFDFLSMEYESSILNRLAAIKPFLKEVEDDDDKEN